LLVRFRRSATSDAEENVELTFFAAVGPVGGRAVGVRSVREWPI
jgi:hypothetical protein